MPNKRKVTLNVDQVVNPDEIATRNFFESLVEDTALFNEFLNVPNIPNVQSVTDVMPQFQGSQSSIDDATALNTGANRAEKPKRQKPTKPVIRKLPYSRSEDKLKEMQVFEKMQAERAAELYQQRFEPKKPKTKDKLPVAQKNKLTEKDYQIIEIRKKEKEEEQNNLNLKQQKQASKGIQSSVLIDPSLFRKPPLKQFDLIKEGENLADRIREQDAINKLGKL